METRRAHGRSPRCRWERSARGSVSRVLSTPFQEMGDHSSRRPVARTLKQSTRTAGPEPALGSNPCHPYSTLLPVGFAMPRPLPSARCAPTAPFHLSPSRSRWRSALCGTFPDSGCPKPPDVIRHRGFRGARTFLPLACTKRRRSEEHTSELQSLMRISYAVFCLKKKNCKKNTQVKGTKTHRKNNSRTQYNTT